MVKTMKESGRHNLDDNALVRLVQTGDASAFSRLVQRHLSLLSRKAGHYASRSGMDAEDFMQEGLIALYRAAGTYRETQQASFRTYASACIENRMVDAVRRFVKSPGSLSLDDMEERRLHKEALPGTRELPPEDVYAVEERLRSMMRQMETMLSDLEQKTLALRLRGYSYGQVSQMLGVSQKSVDNAMQRIRRKLREFRQE